MMKYLVGETSSGTAVFAVKGENAANLTALNPAIGADLTADCFDLAREIRTIDMRASPYDFSDLGLMPIRIETPHGRGEYVEHQRDFAERGALLRRRLMEALTRALDGAGSP